MRLILETWSFSQSSSSSPWSMLSFLLLGLMGGGPVRWLLSAGDCRGCIRGSPLSAASPARGDTTRGHHHGDNSDTTPWGSTQQNPPKLPRNSPRNSPGTAPKLYDMAVGWTRHPKPHLMLEQAGRKGSRRGMITPDDPKG